MYVRGNISGMEMSQRIYFWHQNFAEKKKERKKKPKTIFIRKWQENKFLFKTILMAHKMQF